MPPGLYRAHPACGRSWPVIPDKGTTRDGETNATDPRWIRTNPQSCPTIAYVAAAVAAAAAAAVVVLAAAVAAAAVVVVVAPWLPPSSVARSR